MPTTATQKALRRARRAEAAALRMGALLVRLRQIITAPPETMAAIDDGHHRLPRAGAGRAPPRRDGEAHGGREGPAGAGRRLTLSWPTPACARLTPQPPGRIPELRACPLRRRPSFFTTTGAPDAL